MYRLRRIRSSNQKPIKERIRLSIALPISLLIIIVFFGADIVLGFKESWTVVNQLRYFFVYLLVFILLALVINLTSISIGEKWICSGLAPIIYYIAKGLIYIALIQNGTWAPSSFEVELTSWQDFALIYYGSIFLFLLGLGVLFLMTVMGISWLKVKLGKEDEEAVP